LDRIIDDPRPLSEKCERCERPAEWWSVLCERCESNKTCQLCQNSGTVLRDLFGIIQVGRPRRWWHRTTKCPFCVGS